MNNIRYGNAQQGANGKARPSMPARIPEYYNVSTEEKKDLREQLKSNPLTAIPYEFLLRGTEHPVPTLLTWLGLSFGLDAYSKACGGKYENSLLRKAATLGDKLETSSFVKSKPIQFVLGGFGKVGNWYNKISQKSAILRAINNTPSLPEWPMVKSEMLPHEFKMAEDFFKITNTLHLADEEGMAKLKDLDIGSKEKDAIKKFFNKSSFAEIAEKDAVNCALLKQLGKTDSEIKAILNTGERATELTKSEIRKTLNNISKEELKKVHEVISDGAVFNENAYKTVLDATRAAGKKVRIRAGHYGFLGFLTRPFERIIGCDEVYNKLWSIAKGGPTKTATGRFFSKIMQMSHRGLTFGQGKLGLLLLIAPSLVDVGRDVVKADPDQKIGTAAHGFVDSISWVFTFPLALHIMHKFGGAQYAGMSVDQVGEYRNMLSKLKECKTETEYNKLVGQIKGKWKDSFKGQKWYTKAVRKMARAFTMDLETIKPYKGQGFMARTFKSIPNFFKNCFGVPVRFGVWSVLSMFVLGGLLTKGVQLIFGKAYDSAKHEENKENKKAQKQFLKEDLKERLYKAQAQKQAAVQNGTSQKPMALQGAQTPSKGRPHELSQGYKDEGNIDDYKYIPSSENKIPAPKGKGTLDNYSYIPSSENKLKKDDKSDPNNRKYIPSQAAANIQKTWDNSGLESALKRADKAEQKALKVLSGNFEG
ncbi:hypothetical protein IKQ21_00220 [bacterium]|nr:hypothetical protein [bacterium]